MYTSTHCKDYLAKYIIIENCIVMINIKKLIEICHCGVCYVTIYVCTPNSFNSKMKLLFLIAALDLAQNSNVQDAFVIAVEQQARERLEKLSALKKVKPVDMTKL